jgi:hypothetical protein
MISLASVKMLKQASLSCRQRRIDHVLWNYRQRIASPWPIQRKPSNPPLEDGGNAVAWIAPGSILSPFGDLAMVADSGISMHGRTRSEAHVHPMDLIGRISKLRAG